MTEREDHLAAMEARRDWIVANPVAYRDERLGAINAALEGRKGGPGPIRERKPRPGNESMYGHLTEMAKAYSVDPPDRNARIASDVARLNTQTDALREEIANGR